MPGIRHRTDRIDRRPRQASPRTSAPRERNRRRQASRCRRGRCCRHLPLHRLRPARDRHRASQMSRAPQRPLRGPPRHRPPRHLNFRQRRRTRLRSHRHSPVASRSRIPRGRCCISHTRSRAALPHFRARAARSHRNHWLHRYLSFRRSLARRSWRRSRGEDRENRRSERRPRTLRRHLQRERRDHQSAALDGRHIRFGPPLKHRWRRSRCPRRSQSRQKLPSRSWSDRIAANQPQAMPHPARSNRFAPASTRGLACEPSQTTGEVPCGYVVLLRQYGKSVRPARSCTRRQFSRLCASDPR